MDFELEKYLNMIEKDQKSNKNFAKNLIVFFFSYYFLSYIFKPELLALLPIVILIMALRHHKLLKTRARLHRKLEPHQYIAYQIGQLGRLRIKYPESFKWGKYVFSFILILIVSRLLPKPEGQDIIHVVSQATLFIFFGISHEFDKIYFSAFSEYMFIDKKSGIIYNLKSLQVGKLDSVKISRAIVEDLYHKFPEKWHFRGSAEKSDYAYTKIKYYEMKLDDGKMLNLVLPPASNLRKRA